MSELASIPEQIIPEAKPRTICPICSFDAGNIKKLKTHILLKHPKGQLNSEGIFEVIFSLKMQTKNFKNFCPTYQTNKDLSQKTAYTHQKITKKVLRSLFVW